jgi:hypothetical protein
MCIQVGICFNCDNFRVISLANYYNPVAFFRKLSCFILNSPDIRACCINYFTAFIFKAFNYLRSNSMSPDYTKTINPIGDFGNVLDSFNANTVKLVNYLIIMN